MTSYWQNCPGFESLQRQYVVCWPKLYNGWGSPSHLCKGYKGCFLGGGGKQLATQLHLVLKLKWVKLYHRSPICLHGMDRNNFTFLTFFCWVCWVYIYRQMFYSVDLYILVFCLPAMQVVDQLKICWWLWWWAAGGGEHISETFESV